MAFGRQQFGSQHRPGTKDSPQEGQTISKRLAIAIKKVTEVCQKIPCGIHAAKIIQFVVRASLRKFFNEKVDDIVRGDRRPRKNDKASTHDYP